MLMSGGVMLGSGKPRPTTMLFSPWKKGGFEHKEIVEEDCDKAELIRKSRSSSVL